MRAHLVIDGMNVIGSRPDGWWRDRAGAVRRLLARLQLLVGADEQARLVLVLDGRPLRGVPAGHHDGVEVVYATRRGRDAADDRIVELVGGLDDPHAAEVVTSDRALTDRVRAVGASVTGASALLARLDRLN